MRGSFKSGENIKRVGCSQESASQSSRCGQDNGWRVTLLMSGKHFCCYQDQQRPSPKVNFFIFLLKSMMYKSKVILHITLIQLFFSFILTKMKFFQSHFQQGKSQAKNVSMNYCA